MARLFFGIRNLGIVLCCLGLLACQQAVSPQPPLPDVKIGLVGASQPMGTTDLLAGFIPEDRDVATPDALMDFNKNLMTQLRAQSTRDIRFIRAEGGVDPSAPRTPNRGTVLRYWVEQGRKNGVELLIVPQILNWHEREGSAAGAVSSAGVDINYYLIDVKGEGNMLQRSHFSEKQEGLANNLLGIGTFIQRGGKWLTAQQLADEANSRMIKEFGL